MYIIYHPDIFLHDAIANHVCMDASRMKKVFHAVSAVRGVTLKEAAPASRSQIILAHSDAYHDFLVEKAPVSQYQTYSFDRDTVMNIHTLRAVQLSAGAVCQAIDIVKDLPAGYAFCPVYAGHHATRNNAGGFCFTNPVAIGAKYALSTGASSVAILDFDTHSGNGTIDCVMNDSRILFAETYQAGYPGNFLPGYVPSNVLRTRIGPDSPGELMSAWESMIEKVKEFQPDLVLVSAGFDAHADDPLGEIGLRDKDYIRLATMIREVAPRCVATLEGGYDMGATPRCAALFVEELCAQST